MSTSINCKQCGYANEGERVYCHNCGTKLDRSLLPTDEKTPEKVQKEQKRVKRLVSPSRGFFADAGKKFVITMLLSLLTVTLIQIARKPDGVPAQLKKEDLLDIPPVRISLENLMQAPGPKRLALKEDEINAYLQNVLKAKTTGAVGIEVKFGRAFVKLYEGEIRITTQPSIYDYPLYGTVYYHLTVKNNAIQATCTGGNFGRLPIHPSLMKYLDVAFKQVWTALAKEKKLLDHAQAVDVHKGYIEVTSKPVPSAT